jgi:predicted transcriptional regulator
MILDTAEERCVLEVLKILEKKKARYSVMFKQTKVSHTTLQNVLKDLLGRKFISKDEEGYVISDKGKKFFKKLEELKDMGKV